MQKISEKRKINGLFFKNDLTFNIYRIDENTYLYAVEAQKYDEENDEFIPADVPEEYKDKVFDYDEARETLEDVLPPVKNSEEILPQIKALMAQDEETEQLRKNKALELADGDEVLASVFYANIEYNNGILSTATIVDGIPFYRVGHNASHDFYMGYKDGQRYRYSYGYDDEKEPKPVAVDTFKGYYGHY